MSSGKDDSIHLHLLVTGLLSKEKNINLFLLWLDLIVVEVAGDVGLMVILAISSSPFALH